MRFLGKALLASAFFVALSARADCPRPPGKTISVAPQSAQVIDGDTLHLADGTAVRLIGINTPELGHDGAPDQPLARKATRALRSLLDEKDAVLIPGRQRRDRHGRLLAHLFTRAGSVEEKLLAQGLAWPVLIPPNIALADCLLAAARRAEAAGVGVWREPGLAPRQAGQLDAVNGGFQRIRGRVTGSGRNRRGLWLELDNRVYVPVVRAAAPLFTAEALDGLRGRQVEVRGWLIPRTLSARERRRGYKPFMLNLTHPAMLVPLD